MGSWIRKWHVILAVVIGLYLAIPKPQEPLSEIGSVENFATGQDFVDRDGRAFTIDKSVGVERQEIDGKEYFIFHGRDVQMKKKEGAKETDRAPTAPTRLEVEVTPSLEERVISSPMMQVKVPLAAYTFNLGQDLAGGTSLRYRIASGDLADATSRLYEIFNGWKLAGQLNAASESFRTKAEGYLNAYENGKITGVPSDSILVTAEEVKALPVGDAISEDQIRALDNVIAAFEPLKKESTKDLVEDTINLLQDRLNKSGMTELNIVKAGDNEIEVKLPALPPAELDRIKSTLRTTGRLEFVLLPSKDVFGKEGDKARAAKDVYPSLPEVDSHRYRWYDVDPAVIASELRSNHALVYDAAKQAFVESPKRTKADTPAFRAREWAAVTDRPAVKTRFTDRDGKEHEAWVTPEVCLVQISYPHPDDPDADLRGYPIKGTSLKSAEASSDSNSGKPAVSFELKGEGVSVMSTITKNHTSTDDGEGDHDPRNLAVAIDRKLYSAPTINAELSDRVQVTGSFTRAEVKQYVSILKAGSLSVELLPLGEETIGPAEGKDNIARGWISLLVGASMVLLFALLFYRKTGFLTMLNLVLTIVLIVAIMSLFLSTFTLPGIAGLVLTLGMAIDANILINERIREERRNGASGRVAIEEGFKKAFSAIIDGNVTTLITALILTKIGTGAVAGFALTLSIGILCTLYTALLVYKTTMLWCYDKGLITEVKGVTLFGGSKFNFVGIGMKLALVSVLVMLAAFSFFIYDAVAGNVFGIDFRGGTQVVVQLQESHTRDELRQRIESIKDENGEIKYENVNIQARSIFLAEEADSGEGSSRYEITVPSPAGEDLDGQAAIERGDEITADLRVLLADLLVDEGYKPSVIDPNTIDLEVVLTLVRPTKITDNKAVDHTWLHDATDNEISNEDAPISDWFSSNSGLEGTTLTRLTGDETTQEVLFAARNVAVTSAADAAAKWQDFHKTISDKISKYPEAAKIISGGFPTFADYATVVRDGNVRDFDQRMAAYVRNGRVQARVTLLRPLTKDEFASAFFMETKDSGVGPVRDLTDDKNAIAVAGDGDPNAVASVFTITTSLSELFKLGENAGAQRTEDVVKELETVISKLDTRLRDDPDLVSGMSKPLPKTSVIGGRIAGETQARALLALLISLIAIVIYVGIRFKSTGWGLAAVAALVQDTCLTLGAVALMDYILDPMLGFELKIDLNAIAALLTVIGYSLNDTIVIFDRIREELVKDLNAKRERPMKDVINAAINRTLSRTILTSISTFVVVLAMVFIGGPAIRTFAWTLLFGLLFGTYSSVFRAGPFLLFFTGAKGDLREEIKREEEAKAEAKRLEEEALAAISTDRDHEDEEGEFGEEDFADADFSREAVAAAGAEGASSDDAGDAAESDDASDDEDKA